MQSATGEYGFASRAISVRHADITVANTGFRARVAILATRIAFQEALEIQNRI